MKKVYTLLVLVVLLIGTYSYAQVNILTQSFDATTFPPTAGGTWTRAHISGGASGDTWKRATAATGAVNASWVSAANPGPHSGAGMAYFNCYNYSSGSTANLVTPALNFTGAASGIYKVSFWMYRGDGIGLGVDKLNLFVSTATTGGTSLATIYQDITQSPSVPSEGWYQYTYTIPSSFATATNYIIFQGVSDYWDDIIIDDVSVDYYPNCTGTPATPIVDGTSSICASTSFALSSTTNTGTGITHQWESAPSATGPWTAVGSGSTYTSTGVTATTYYRLTDLCTFSALSATSAVFTVNVTTGFLCSLCSPTTTSGCANDHFTNVTFSTINNSIGCTGLTSGVSLYTSPCPNLTAGSTYTLTVSTYGSFGGDDAQAWIDYNQNGTFATGENVMTSYSSGGDNNTFTVGVTIPSGATPGITVLRLRCNYNGSTYTVSPCNNYSYGQTQDYYVNIVAPCTSAPTAVAATPSGTTLCVGNTLTLTGAATGATSYSWTGPNSFTAAVLTPAAFTVGTASAGVYTLVATNSCGSTTVTTSAITVTAPPTAVLATASATTLCAGDVLTLTGTATGGTSTSWSGPGGYSASVLNPPSFVVSASSSGFFTLTVANSCGTSITNTAAITVNTVPVTVSAAASATTVCLGSTLMLTGTATGATSYTWSGPDGYTAAVLNPVGFTTTALSAGIYTLTATNACGSTTATTASITIMTVPTAVTAAISAATLCSGDALTLTGAATGATSYSWSGPGGYSAAVLNPAVITTSTSSAGIYTLTATNVCGNTTGTTAALVINTAPTVVTATAAPATLCAGDPLTLTGSATSPITVTYGWAGPVGYASAVQNPSAITATTSSAGIYTLTATNSCGSTTGTTASVTVNTVPTAVTATPSSSALCSGDILTLTGAATSPITTTYSWAGPDAFTSTDLSPAGITTSTLSAGVYTLTATNICGNTVATTPPVVINTVPSAVTATASATTLCAGNSLTLTGVVTNATSYLWDGPDGYTSTSLNPVAIITTTLSTGVYTLTATNGCGSETGTTALVTVNTTPTSVTATPSAATLCSGATLTLTGAATGAVSYAWSGPDGFTSTDLNPAGIVTNTLSAGIYTLTATNSCGNTVATTASIVIHTVPTSVTATASPTTLCSGNTLSLTGSAASPVTTTYSWSGPNSYSSAVLSPSPFVTSTLSAGVYTLTATNICGSTVATTASVTVNRTPTGVTATALPTSVCSGAVLTLTGTSGSPIATTYSWSGPNGYSSAVLNPASFTSSSLSAGIYTLTATNVCGNTTATTAAVIVVSPPTSVSASTIASSFCAGASLSLVGTATGATNYNWSGPAGYTSALLNPSAFTAGTASSGTYTLSAGNSCFTVTATASIVIAPLPPMGPIMGTTTLCEGTITNLSDTVLGGVWISNNPAVATINASGVVTGVNMGSAIISYTNTNTCGTALATTTITVMPVPAASPVTGASAICQGSSSLYVNAITGGTWSSSNPAVAVIGAGGVATGIGIGSATISYTVNNGCGTAVTDTLAISVTTAPDAGNIFGAVRVCMVDTIRLFNHTAGGTWYVTNARATINATDGLVTGSASGLDTAYYVVTNMCGTDTARYTFYIYTAAECAALGVGTVSVSDVNCILYPNPNSGSFTLSGTWVDADNEATIEIVDLLGQVVYKKAIKINNGKIDEQVQLSGNLSSGMYMLRINSVNAHKAIRFTISQ